MFGKELRKQRNDLGLGVRETARRLGVTPAYICHVELETCAPLTLKRIAELGNHGFNVQALARASVRDKGTVDVPVELADEVADLVMAYLVGEPVF